MECYYIVNPITRYIVRVHVQQVVLSGYMTAKVAEKENQVMSEAS